MNTKTKDSRPMSFRIDADIADRLENYCGETGMSKTATVEKALEMYLDDHAKKQKILEEALKSN